MMRRILAICAIAIGLAGAAQAQSLDDQIGACDELKNLTESIECHTETIRQNPKSVEALLARAISYDFNGQYDLAVADLQRAISIAPEESWLYFELGVIHGQNEKYELAIYNFSKAIEIEPLAVYYASRALSFLLAGKPSQGLPDADAAIERNPDSAMSWETRGEIYEALGDNAKAAADFEKALELDPDMADAQEGLARVSGSRDAAGKADQSPASYSLRICNRSGEDPIYAAIAVYDDVSHDSWTIHAWYKIANGACNVVATRSFGGAASVDAAVHAQSDTALWRAAGNGDVDYCVDRENAYTRRIGGGTYECGSHEGLFGFRIIRIERRAPATTFTYTFE